MRCFVWLFDSFRFLKGKGILVVGDLVAFWFGWFYEKSPMCAKPCQTNLWITGWDGNKNEYAVPTFPVTQKQGWKKRLCVWSLSKSSYNWGWWFGVIWYPKSSTSNNLETPFRFPTCFVVRPAAKQRSLVVGRRIGHPRNGLTLRARHRDLLGQHWFSLDIKITSIKNNI